MPVLRRLATVPAGRRTKWVVLLFWFVVAVVAGPLSGRLQSVEKNDPSSFLPGSAESTAVLDEQKRFPGGDSLPAVVVYRRGSGLTAADLAEARAQAGELAHEPFAAGPASALVRSDDGTTAQYSVPIRVTDGFALSDQIDTVRGVTRGGGGLATYVTGPAGVQADSASVFQDIDSTLLFATLVVVVAILLVTYRSPLLWIFPVVAAAVSLVSAQAANYVLARYAGLTVNGQSAGILLVLVFGAGTDYALLLVARYREELWHHDDRHEAMARALRRAGPPILASAVTVVLGLLCLLVAELESNRGLGPVAAVGITCALAVMLTLLPALLAVAGRWVFWPFVPHRQAGGEEHALWERFARRVTRHPGRVAGVAGLALGVLCVGLVTLDTAGLTDSESFRNTPESVRGEQVLASRFPTGTASPVIVIGRAAKAAALTRATESTAGVVRVEPPTVSGDLVRLDVVARAAPNTGAAFDTVDRLRDSVRAVPGADAKVGGSSAVNLDVRRAAAHDTRVVVPLVLAVVFGVLAVLLRALVAPGVLVATVVLSYAAALGASAFAFDVIFGFGGSDPTFPLFVFIFLVALGVDYNIFLMSRVREEARGSGTRDAVVRGVAVTGGVITSAGTVLAATFSVLWVLPLVALDQIGFAVGFGVLLDTFVVRSVLVPALVVRIGRRAWWPSALSRGAAPGPPASGGP